MAGENFTLDLTNLVGGIGQEIAIEEEEGKVAIVEDSTKQKPKDEIKDGDLVTDDDGEVKVFNSKKHLEKEKKEPEEIVEEENTKNARQEDKKVPTTKKEGISPYSPYAETLKEEGILPDLNIEEFNKLPKDEQVAKLISSYKDGMIKEAENHIETKFPSILKDVAKLVLEAGEYVPLRQLMENRSDIQELNNVSDKQIEDDEDLQEELINIHLSETTSFSKEKIAKEIVRLKASDELMDEAKDAKKELTAIMVEKDKQMQVQAREDAKKATEQRTTAIKTIHKYIDDATELFPGKKLSTDQKKDLKKYITEPVGYTKQGAPISKVMEIRAKDPVRFDILLTHYATQLGLFDEKVNTEGIEKTAKSKAVKGLADILEKNNAFNTHASNTDTEEVGEKDITKETLKGMSSFLDATRQK